LFDFVFSQNLGVELRVLDFFFFSGKVNIDHEECDEMKLTENEIDVR